MQRAGVLSLTGSKRSVEPETGGGSNGCCTRYCGRRVLGRQRPGDRFYIARTSSTDPLLSLGLRQPDDCSAARLCENASEVRGGEAFPSVFAFHLVGQLASDRMARSAD